MNGIATHAAALRVPAGVWDAQRELEFAPLSAPGVVPGRVLAANRELFHIRTAGGETEAVLAGRLRRKLDGKTLPVAGDWAAVDIRGTRAVVQDLLARRSFFSRQAAGKNVAEQIVAANIDYALFALGLDGDFNLNRLDRYLIQARHGKVQPVIVLTKADVCRDVPAYLARTEYELGGDVRVHAVSVHEEYGLADLEPYMQPGCTCILIGSSGVGKSTLINRLLHADAAATGHVSRGNGRGRHTTSCARLYETPAGAWLLDSPGIREMQLWADDASRDRAFSDIASFAAHCRFRDCTHQGEPGCAVQQALLQGALSQERFLSYMKLNHELGETKEAMLRHKRERFKKIAVLSRQYRRMHPE